MFSLAIFHLKFNCGKVAKWTVLFDFEPNFGSRLAIGFRFNGDTYFWGFFLGERTYEQQSVALESADYEEQNNDKSLGKWNCFHFMIKVRS